MSHDTTDAETMEKYTKTLGEMRTQISGIVASATNSAETSAQLTLRACTRYLEHKNYPSVCFTPWCISSLKPTGQN